MKFILPADPTNPSKINPLFIEEYEAAKKYADVILFDLDAFMKDENSFAPPKRVAVEKVIHHGWMMDSSTYNTLNEVTKYAGYKLINEPEQYDACHYTNGWLDPVFYTDAEFSLVPYTFETVLIPGIDNIDEMVEETYTFQQKTKAATVVKDYVKSLKHNKDLFIIPQFQKVTKLLEFFLNFKKEKDENNDFQKGIVLRKFEKLVSVEGKDYEFRYFILNGKPFYSFPRFNPALISEKPGDKLVSIVADKVFKATGNKLFCLDFALKANGQWVLVEVGDGQVSSLEDYTTDHKEDFFKELAANV